MSEKNSYVTGYVTGNADLQKIARKLKKELKAKQIIIAISTDESLGDEFSEFAGSGDSLGNLSLMLKLISFTVKEEEALLKVYHNLLINQCYSETIIDIVKILRKLEPLIDKVFVERNSWEIYPHLPEENKD